MVSKICQQFFRKVLVSGENVSPAKILFRMFPPRMVRTFPDGFGPILQGPVLGWLLAHALCP